MEYKKPALTLEDQADLLMQRGMTGDRHSIITRLDSTSYYRMSGYWCPYKCTLGENFRPGTTFDDVWNRYAFDRRLRVLVIDAIERIEIALRAWLAYEHSHAHGAFGYADDPSTLSGLSWADHSRLIKELREELARSKEVFANHFRAKYGSHHVDAPIWIASEIMTFGQTVTFFRGVSARIKQVIAGRLGIHDKVLASWLLTLNTVRNVCAHHGRLWNRGIGTKPRIPVDSRWRTPVDIKNDQMFGVLSILKFSLDKIAPQSAWRTRFDALISEFPSVPLRFMGFPDNWRQSPVWKPLS